MQIAFFYEQKCIIIIYHLGRDNSFLEQLENYKQPKKKSVHLLKVSYTKAKSAVRLIGFFSIFIQCAYILTILRFDYHCSVNNTITCLFYR